jgi:hypothetical protein
VKFSFSAPQKNCVKNLFGEKRLPAFGVVKKEILSEVRRLPDKFISFSVTQKKFSSYFAEQVLPACRQAGCYFSCAKKS